MKTIEKEKIVHEVVEGIYNAYPFLWEKFGQNGRERTTEDNYHHLNHLETTYQLNDFTFFLDYTEWLERVLTSRNVGTELIIDNYQRLHSSAKELEDEDERCAYQHYLSRAIQHLQQS
ncbi:hypothetical protein GLW08_19040 [Pontibacillus yanchengensis]|uniref:Uncharacterized protein n=1 Tax=Pontibacillus yanchengensis TaxID=462910 RepID=A0ACC7VKV9_9BACI|nr:hypothetical protein [Pontibacillus yanchengensis]MYL55413.1 hypothetical protein [Pontibacillus yanchengensis]